MDDFGEGIHLQLKNLLLPAIVLGIRPLAVVSQLMRNSLLEVLSQDYIRTAKAKGLSSYQVIKNHALKNALNLSLLLYLDGLPVCLRVQYLLNIFLDGTD